MTNIKMPALSPTMTSGTLAKWLVKEGDNVKSGDIIAEIETDKATMELESIDDGIVNKILFKEGEQNIEVGTVIAKIGDEDQIDDETNSNIDNNNSSSSEEMEKLNEENEKKLNAMKISKQFTEEELEGIKTFRSRIKGKIADLKDDSFEKMYYNEDTTIWRYVLAQSQESDPMEKSEQMFFDSIKWRKDIKMYENKF